MPISIPLPKLQIAFATTLEQLRATCLQPALANTVTNSDLTQIDSELTKLVPMPALRMLAAAGLRGELVFPVPYILTANPSLLGYYRLLLGLSQKEFYKKDHGTVGFKSMEEQGRISPNAANSLQELCTSMITSAANLLDSVPPQLLAKELLNDLTLLTLGPQLRGGANVRRGGEANDAVFALIHEIVKPFATKTTKRQIVIKNAAKREVLIEFAPDPDIVIRENMGDDNFRRLVAIEVKGGRDYSNIHNRVGEAEKSHQKARQSGFTECWTVVNVDGFDKGVAKRESPSTDQFYQLSELEKRKSQEYEDFRARITSATGVPSLSQRRKRSP